MRRKRANVSRLQVQRSWTSEATDQSFAGTESGDDAARSRALHPVLAVPGYEVAVVDEVLFAFDELSLIG